MINSLTEKQKSRLPEFIKKWTNIGLCTKPANRTLAEEGIIEAYLNAGIEAPKIVWCDSPLTMAITRSIIKQFSEGKIDIGASVRASVWASVRDSVWASVWASVGASVWDSVGASVRDSVGDSVWDSVWASVRDSVGASVRDSVGASVRDSVWASVWASVRDSVGASVWASVRDSVWDSGYGQHDANWLGFYDFFFEVCGLEQQTKKLSGLWKISQNAGWFLPHEKICWISERHTVVSKDDGGQLHNESGPAVLYPDGWGIYKIHGVTVPAFVIENPEQITVDVIEKEENSEVRRCMIDRYGRGKYLKDTGAMVINQDDWGTLYQKDIPGQEPMVFVAVVNSTAEPDGSFNDYFLRVHPKLMPITNNRIVGGQQRLTALNAVASTFGLTGEEYIFGLTESPSGTPEMAIKIGRMS